MPIEVKHNIDIPRLTQEMRRQLEEQLERELQFASTEIVQRTQSGRDVNGSSFQAYTKQYKAWKSRRGRSGSVDLTFSGKMLGAIQTRITTEGKNLIGRIFFNSSAEAAKAKGNQRLRKFFGLSREQLARITKALKINF